MPHIMADYNGIMVINTTTSHQRTITGGTYNGVFFDMLKEIGIRKEQIYYTCLQKCVSDLKTCKTTCYEHLKQEIINAAPKLIICFAIDAVSLFINEKMAKLDGMVMYVAEFNCYVLFSYSPQYSEHKGESGIENLKNNIIKLKKIIHSH